MAREVVIAIEIAEIHLAKSILDEMEGLPDVQALQWVDGIGEKGQSAVKGSPDIIILDEHPQAGDLFKRIHALRRNFPQTALFVISSDKSPHHIVEVMKAGVAEYLITPLDRNTLQAAIDEVRTKLANEGKIAKGSVYSFISSKGGLGSTVIAVNTAAAMAAKKNEAVAFLDMSFQAGDSSVLLDIAPNTTITDIARNFHRLDASFLRGVMAPTPSRMDFLAAPLNPEESEEIIPAHVTKILDLARKLYDHIVIDCASMFVGECTIEAFRASDKVFVVTDLSVPAIRNAARLVKLIQKLEIPSSRVEIAVNRFIKGGSHFPR